MTEGAAARSSAAGHGPASTGLFSAKTFLPKKPDSIRSECYKEAPRGSINPNDESYENNSGAESADFDREVQEYKNVIGI